MYKNIINYLKTLASSLKIINKCEKKLENNVTIEKNILNIIMKQLNFTMYVNLN